MDDIEMDEASDDDSNIIDLTEEVTPPEAPKSQPRTDKSQENRIETLAPKPAPSSLDILAAISSRASDELHVAQTLATISSRASDELNVAQALVSLPKTRPRPRDPNINTEVVDTIPGASATPSSPSGGVSTSTTISTLPSSITSASSATSSTFKSPLPTLTPADSNSAAVLANHFPDCPMLYLGLNFAQDFPSAFPIAYFPNITYLNLRALNLDDFQEHPDLSSLPIKRLDFRRDRLEHELLAIRARSCSYKGASDITLHYHRTQIDLTDDDLRELRGHLLSNTAMFKRDNMKLESTETELAIAAVQRTEEMEKTVAEKQKRLSSVPRFSGATWKHIGLTEPKKKDDAGEGPAPK